MSQAVEVDFHQEVATIRLNRPRAHNAVNEEVIEGLEKALRDLDRMLNVRFLILTGAGDQSFCVGGDLKYFNSLKTRDQGVQAASRMCSILDRLSRGPQVVFAAINGRALGGGCEILSACHFRVTIPSAEFSYLQAANGLTTGWGGGVRLFNLIGRAQALRLLLASEKISAEEANRIGLVDHVVPPHQLTPMIQDLIQKIRVNSSGSVSGFLELATLANLEKDVARTRELEIFGERWDSTDFRRRLADFIKDHP